MVASGAAAFCNTLSLPSGTCSLGVAASRLVLEEAIVPVAYADRKQGRMCTSGRMMSQTAGCSLQALPALLRWHAGGRWSHSHEAWPQGVTHGEPKLSKFHTECARLGLTLLRACNQLTWGRICKELLLEKGWVCKRAWCVV